MDDNANNDRMSLSKNQIIAVVAVVVIVVAAAAVALSMGSGNGGDGDRDSSYSDGQPVTITTFTDYNGNTAELTFYDIPDRVV
ncbi:MAG TPA: hypothetical protein IAC83_05670, partial [Euryarchaeota archaeon]|nr:hypothetical protein [Euryarchaeota archaeon]